MPKVRGKLKDYEEAKIQSNYVFLMEQLDGEFYAVYLFQEGVFDFDDKEDIFNQSTKRRKADVFLTKLLQSGPIKAYNKFLEALKEHSPHIAQRLEEMSQESNVDLTNTQVESKINIENREDQQKIIDNDALQAEIRRLREENNDLREQLLETRDDPRSSFTAYDDAIIEHRIRYLFVSQINPFQILYVFRKYDRHVLSEWDTERVLVFASHYGKCQGAAELLSYLVKYPGWFQCLLKVLRDPKVKQAHVADMMEKALLDESETSDSE